MSHGADEFDVVSDGLQFLECISSVTSNDEEMFLSQLLSDFCSVHASCVGPRCRVNFIVFVVLHVYLSLLRDPVLKQNNGAMEDDSCVNFDGNVDELPSPTSGESDIAQDHCWALMADFVKEFRLRCLAVSSYDVLAEIISSKAQETSCHEYGNDVSSALSADVVADYLQRTFAYDSLSLDSEGGRLAAEYFTRVYARLRFALGNTGLDNERLGEVSAHALVEQLLWRVSDCEGRLFTMGGCTGCVLPGVALVATLRIDRIPCSFTSIGTCVLSPLGAIGRLLVEDKPKEATLLLFSHCPPEMESDGTEVHALALAVKEIKEHFVIIVVKEYVSENVLRCMQTWGSDSKTVLVVTAVGASVTDRLALMFCALPRVLGSTKVSSLPCRFIARPLVERNEVDRKNQESVHLRSFLLALQAVQPAEINTFLPSTAFTIASVVFGGRCQVGTALIERHFSRQLHHLVNVFCLYPDRNLMVPGGGLAEAHAVSFLGYLLRVEAGASSCCRTESFKVSLLKSLRDAISAYMERVLVQSGGLTVEDAAQHLQVSEQRLSKIAWKSRDRRCWKARGMSSPDPCEPPGRSLYAHFTPPPPLLCGPEATWTVNYDVNSTLLLADIKEWEAQVEVASTYLCIGRCLDRLCFSSVVGRQKEAGAHGDQIVSGLFLHPDVV
ncbi:hypothetical protein ERJ75_000215800 [Trypanosoma vivax]|nr:hypothetical protein ERJ75_000215800 [Trypanosoma vivax]